MKEVPEEPASPRRRSRLGCAGIALAALAATVGMVVLIGETFDQGGAARQPVRKFDAGPAENYQPADLSYLQVIPVYVVRLQDGEFLALYDRSPKQQEIDGACRVHFDEFASLGAAEPVPGIRGALVEDCEGIRTVWRPDGNFAFGAGYGDLDRFEVAVDNNGNLIINLDARTCTRSRGVIGAPPFDVRRCRKPSDI